MQLFPTLENSFHHFCGYVTSMTEAHRKLHSPQSGAYLLAFAYFEIARWAGAGEVMGSHSVMQDLEPGLSVFKLTSSMSLTSEPPRPLHLIPMSQYFIKIKNVNFQSQTF